MGVKFKILSLYMLSLKFFLDVQNVKQKVGHVSLGQR